MRTINICTSNFIRPFGKFAVCAILSILLAFINTLVISAQTNPSKQSSVLSKKARKHKKKIEKIKRFSDITIIKNNNKHLYGTILSINSESVLIDEVDQKKKVEIKYEEIKKIHKNYGSSRDRKGNRIPPKKHLIGIALASAAILVPIILLVTSKEN